MNDSTIIRGFDVYVALRRAGWRIKRYYRSLRVLESDGRPDFNYDSVSNADRIGPRMLARIEKHTGLSPVDVRALVDMQDAGRADSKQRVPMPDDL